MFKVYILQSVEHGRFYIGFSSNVEKRLGEHNEGKVKSTKYYRPYTIIYTEDFSDRGSAMKREKEIKKMKSGKHFHDLIKNAGVAQG